MGITTSTETVNVETIRRVYRLTFESPKPGPIVCEMRYEDCKMQDGVYAGSTHAETYRFSPEQLASVSIDVGGGRMISGDDVARFMFIFNDTMKTYFPDASPIDGASPTL